MKKKEVLVIRSGLKKQFWYLLGCSASKGPQGGGGGGFCGTFQPTKYMTGGNVLCKFE